MMSIPATVACRNCGGLGICGACNGTGKAECRYCDDGLVAYTVWSYPADEPFDGVEYCDYCGGSGVEPCAECGGSGLCDTCNGCGEEVA